MASVLFTIGGVVVNVVAFSGTKFVFNRLTDHGAEGHKRHDLALEELQRARDEWNRDRMKRLDLINRRLPEKNEERSYIKDVGEVMPEYYRVIAKKKKNLYHLSLSYQISIIHQRHKEMVNYYLF